MNINFEHVIALRKAFGSVRKRQKENIPPDLTERKRRLRAVREECVGNDNLIRKTVDALLKNGIKVHQAKSKEEALEIVFKEIGSEKLVVKSKSNVTKEIELVKELEKSGINAVETDIGDRIMQLLGSKPSHPTGPIAHLSAIEIVGGLKEKHGIEIKETPEDIVSFVRDDIVKNFKEAKIGITGANAITAEEGSILLVHNEGNIFETMKKEKHIVVTSIDKIYPNIEDAINMIKILTYSATGAIIPSFIEVISGVTKTADVEKRFFSGIHSPKEVVVVLLDNKRSEIINNGFKELLYCIGCGNCLVYCPVYNILGNEYGDSSRLGGRGLAYSSIVYDKKEDMLDFCLACEKCKINCPVDINIPKVIKNLRSDNKASETYYFFKSHLYWLYYSLKLLAHRPSQ